jgi:hypothetical protein
MLASTGLKVYAQYSTLNNKHNKKTMSALKHNNNSPIEEKTTTPASITMWTYLRGERINLDILVESILLNNSFRHIALLQHLTRNQKYKNNKNNSFGDNIYWNL